MTTLTYETIANDLDRFYGSEHFYSHCMFRNLIYTDGIKHLCGTYGTYWFLDMIASYFPEVTKENVKNSDWFNIVGIDIDENHKGHFYIKHDTYADEYIKQDLDFANLPKGKYEVYLIGNSEYYTVLLKSEY